MKFDDQWVCGEMHYPRIPPAYWRNRMQMARAMGLDAISTYVFWNVHESAPGTYDFSGENDVAAFVRTAHEEGLHVILRPGPYVCAEWDFGGLPSWLLANGPIALRSTAQPYFGHAERWLMRLGKELAPLQQSRGGPIFAVQLENEYGAFGEDKVYLRALAALLARAGFDESPLFTIDQPGDLARGSIEEVPIAVTFAPGDAGAQFAAAEQLRPGTRRICGEYWAGWFDHWGEPHAELDAALQVRDLEWMLNNGVALNVYMFHGGTNAQFWNGANAFEPHDYQSTVTSYDYQAALDEGGRPTAKFHAFREVIECFRGMALPAVPDPPFAIDVAPFELDRAWPLDAGAGDLQPFDEAPTMEAAGFDRGFMLYRTRIAEAFDGDLEFGAVRDYAVAYVDGTAVATLDRRKRERSVRVSVSSGATLDVLVENCGRINYGARFPFDNKGIVGGVRLGGVQLRGFSVAAFGPQAPRLRETRAGGTPVWFSGTFSLDRCGDTYIDTGALGKGALWINGRAAGRFWSEGPQRALFVPAAWLRPGSNEVLALDFHASARSKVLRGAATAEPFRSSPKSSREE